MVQIHRSLFLIRFGTLLNLVVQQKIQRQTAGVNDLNIMIEPSTCDEARFWDRSPVRS
jgi:hypothetical protein